MNTAEVISSPPEILDTVPDKDTFLEIVKEVMGTADWDKITKQLLLDDLTLVVQCFNVRSRRIQANLSAEELTKAKSELDQFIEEQAQLVQVAVRDRLFLAIMEWFKAEAKKRNIKV